MNEEEAKKIVRRWYRVKYERGDISKKLRDANFKAIETLEIHPLRYHVLVARRDFKRWGIDENTPECYDGRICNPQDCDGSQPCPDGTAFTPEAIEIANKRRLRRAMKQFNKD